MEEVRTFPAGSSIYRVRMYIVNLLASETFTAILFAILLFLAASVWGTRLNYVFNYRNADLNAFCLAKQVTGKKLSYLSDAAKRYLQVSEDYRRTAVYLTNLAASLIFSAGFVGISAIAAFLLRETNYWYLSLIPLFLGLFLAFVSALSLALTWSNQRTMWFLNYLGNIIPGLRASELRRWTFIQEVIDGTDWLKDSLQEIEFPLPQCETSLKKL